MGIITKIFNWTKHPSIETDNNPSDYAAGLALILIAAFLWSRVVKQLVES